MTDKRLSDCFHDICHSLENFTRRAMPNCIATSANYKLQVATLKELKNARPESRRVNLSQAEFQLPAKLACL